MVDLGLSTNQLKNAQTIVAVGKADGFDDADIATAVMVAITESGLQNYANEYNQESLSLPHDAVGSDHGSVGIFQQQVGGAPNSTANWGTTQQLMDPATAAEKFYQAMRQKFPHGTTGTSPWMVAQSVQGSAYSDGSNYQKNWTQALTIEAALIGSANSIPHNGKPGGPWPVNTLKAPLSDSDRNKLIQWLIANSSPWQGDPQRLQQRTHLQKTADNDLIATYNQLSGGYSVQGGDPGVATPGVGPVSLTSWMDSLGKILGWFTNVKNWERVGLFVLGALLVIFTFNKMFGNPIGTGAKVAALA